MLLVFLILSLFSVAEVSSDIPKFIENFRERPESFFCQNLDKLQDRTTPAHFILSGYLRKSMTFSLYQKAMDHFEIEGEFLPYELPLQGGYIDREALQHFLNVFRANPFLQTLIVSDPYKQVIVDYLDELASAAIPIKTVNLVYKMDGQLIGDNIDATAFLLGAQEEMAFEYEGRSMLFFGCGGVSSAIAFKLAPKLKKMGLVDINVERSEKLALLLKEFYPLTSVIVFDRKGPLNFSDFDIFYNGTGLGKFSKDPNSLSCSPLIEGDIFPSSGVVNSSIIHRHI
jgi:shikimate 5-dehydrogenase